MDFVPIDGFNPQWLKSIFFKYIVRSRAVGKDGIRIQEFANSLDKECEFISDKVNLGNYSFTNYREKLILRGPNRNPRQISIPSVRDRLVLRAALEFIKFHFPEAQSIPPHHFVKDIKIKLPDVRLNSSFLRMDIKDFYPSLRHDLLQDILTNSEMPERVTLLIMSAIAVRTGSMSRPLPTVGVPQGLSISNALSALYMINFDKFAENIGLFYRRYVDDIIAIDHSESINETYFSLWRGLNEIGLSSHPMGTVGKTETRKLGEGVQYLGYDISPSKISVRQSSMGKIFTNLSKVITSLKYKRDIDKHVFRLNLKITGCIVNNGRRGWLMFFSQIDDISQLAYLDEWLKTQIAKIGIKDVELKKFKRSYYEIRFNLKNSIYIPNFDQYDLNQKIHVVKLLSRRKPEEVEAMDVLLLESEFNRLIGREVSELERDIQWTFS